jgi:hypothetical protein
MSCLRPEFYAEWHARNASRLILRDHGGQHPPERLLQSVWHHQRLRRDQLQTIDGKPLCVLHPGFWNREAGPDFRGAIIQVGEESPRSGDVEIDLTSGNWRGHQHHSNPAYAKVVLHVIWQGESAAVPGQATLALEPFLDRPLAEMQSWATTAGAGDWPELLRGACSAPLGHLTKDQCSDLLRQAALVRFHRKGADLELRARDAGWEQALWEGLLRGLGYKNNVWPMQRVAELRPRLQASGQSFIACQARLLGVSGLLPEPPELGQPSNYLRALWDHWWRDRENFADVILPKSAWRMNGLRPANQPQRRLALAAHWLSSDAFAGRLERWFTDEGNVDSQPQSLRKCLQPATDDFWSWHWSFSSPRLTTEQWLLGEARATDLAVNTILPWFWTRARAGKNERLTKWAEERYLAWPAAEDNGTLRLARHRLLGRQTSDCVRTAAHQQGLLQIVRDFCDHSNALCADCQFPSLVQELTQKPIPPSP